MISLDHSILLEDPGSDTRERHLDYARELGNRSPGSTLHMIVKSPKALNLSVTEFCDNLKVYPTNSLSGLTFFFDALNIGRKICKGNDVKLITTQGPFDDGLAGLILSYLYGANFLVQLRPTNLDDSYWLKERKKNHFLRLVGRRVCKAADGVRVVSRGSKRWCKEELGMPDNRLYLNYIPMSMLKEERESTYKVDSKTIIYVGRLSKEKGVEYLIKAFPHVLDEVEDSELHVIGGGPEKEKLESLVDSLGIGERVEFTGEVPYEDLGRYYKKAAVLALPSLRENFGRVIIEAFMYGVPVVATKTEGPSELIKEGETGFLVPRKDTDMMARFLIKLLKQPNLREELGTNGKEFVNKNFDQNRLVENLIDTWIEVAKNSSSPDSSPDNRY